MAQTFSLVCEETRKKIWVGQGTGKMTSFYTGEPRIMERLGIFLREHEGKTLRLLCDDWNAMLLDYEEFGRSKVEKEDS
jgi:hypothetical protein